MKIDTKSFVKQIQAHAILHGHCFMWNGDVYMRIRDISEVDRKGQIMAVNMESGNVEYFTATASVIQIDNIEAKCTDKENDNETES